MLEPTGNCRFREMAVARREAGTELGLPVRAAWTACPRRMGRPPFSEDACPEDLLPLAVARLTALHLADRWRCSTSGRGWRRRFARGRSSGFSLVFNREAAKIPPSLGPAPRPAPRMGSGARHMQGSGRGCESVRSSGCLGSDPVSESAASITQRAEVRVAPPRLDDPSVPSPRNGCVARLPFARCRKR